MLLAVHHVVPCTQSPNVLLSEEGVAKIADVGMSRAQEAELVSAQPIMTPLWSAPEVREVGRKCFGVVAVEMVVVMVARCASSPT
jgi:serine/threonine protein kinase